MTSTPTRPVDNVVITTKGLQDRNINILDETTVENKGKLILLMLTFLIRSTTSESSSYVIVLTRLGEFHSRPNPHLKFWKCQESNL